GGVYLFGRKNPKKIEAGALVGVLILSLYGVKDGVIDQGQTFLNWNEFTQLTYWRGFLPHGGAHTIVWSDWRITPPLFYLLMYWGIWKAERKTRYILGIWLLCSWIPVSTKLFPIADAIRLWYPLQLPLLVFVGVGAGAIAQRWGSKGLILAFSVSLLPHVTWIEQRWIQQREWSLAKEALHLIPEGDRLQMDSSIDKWEKKAMVFAWLYPGTLEVIPFRDEDGWFWRGPFCSNQRACRSLWERCSVEAYRTWRLGNETDVDIYIEDSEVDVGLYRVQNCSAQEIRE
ncbi:MAG: hypothetical protein VX278_17100, partial [Myxococcota bacterium]|nr:hypothetical protein [Myxococcota bacterium]